MPTRAPLSIQLTRIDKEIVKLPILKDDGIYNHLKINPPGLNRALQEAAEVFLRLLLEFV